MTARPGRLVLLGHPVSHSLSPVFQNAALVAAGIPLSYELLDVAPADVPATAALLATQRASGNVTIPHKAAMLGCCASVSPLAARVGAVNTFWTNDGALTGDNTDVAGFDALVDSVTPRFRHSTVTMLGAGGAAAAVVVALQDRGVKGIRVYNRTRSRAEELAGRFDGVVVCDSVEDAVRDATLIVNATPAMEACVFDDARSDAAFVDLAYAPGGTAWVREARAQGFVAADGFEMLLVQGARSFERWFGFAPDLAVMRRALASVYETRASG
jgi:shikimate dehydrogenase